jgi:hypothetical protein
LNNHGGSISQSLLRNLLAVSRTEELTDCGFQEVLDNSEI